MVMPSYPATKIDSEIGALIWAYRLKHGFSIAEIARRLDVTHERVRLLERGERRWGAEELIALSNILNFSIDQEFGKKTNKRKTVKP